MSDTESAFKAVNGLTPAEKAEVVKEALTDAWGDSYFDKDEFSEHEEDITDNESVGTTVLASECEDICSDEEPDPDHLVIKKLCCIKLGNESAAICAQYVVEADPLHWCGKCFTTTDNVGVIMIRDCEFCVTDMKNFFQSQQITHEVREITRYVYVNPDIHVHSTHEGQMNCIVCTPFRGLTLF